MSPTTTTPTPLTDAELEALYRDAGWKSMAEAAAEIRALRAQIAQHAQAMGRVTDENQGLRATRDDLLAALKECAEFWMNDTPVYPGSEAAHDALAAIGRALDARAEGGAEG